MNQTVVDPIVSVRPFSVRGGNKADLLWGLLYEMGIRDAAQDRVNPQVEFVVSEHAITRPEAVIILLAVEAESNEAVAAVGAGGWADDVIFVDATGEAREVNKRCIARWLDPTSE